MSAGHDAARADLKPCPFCGNAAVRDTADDGGKYIRCSYCQASSSLHYDRTENLDDCWNRRAGLGLTPAPEGAQAAHVGLEPPGCPTPGACSCPGGEVELAKRLGEAQRALRAQATPPAPAAQQSWRELALADGWSPPDPARERTGIIIDRAAQRIKELTAPAAQLAAAEALKPLLEDAEAIVEWASTMMLGRSSHLNVIRDAAQRIQSAARQLATRPTDQPAAHAVAGDAAQASGGGAPAVAGVTDEHVLRAFEVYCQADGRNGKAWMRAALEAVWPTPTDQGAGQ